MARQTSFAVNRIVGRMHVSDGYDAVARRVLSKLIPTTTARQRAAITTQALIAHRNNRNTYARVMRGY